MKTKSPLFPSLPPKSRPCQAQQWPNQERRCWEGWGGSAFLCLSPGSPCPCAWHSDCLRIRRDRALSGWHGLRQLLEDLLPRTPFNSLENSEPELASSRERRGSSLRHVNLWFTSALITPLPSRAAQESFPSSHPSKSALLTPGSPWPARFLVVLYDAQPIPDDLEMPLRRGTLGS